jgi:hypothetical protein
MATATKPALTAQPTRTSHGLRRFVLHYLEMVVAMAVGMVVLHPVWSLGLGALGQADVLNRIEVMALVMATNMTVAMSAWMRYRGHGWAGIAEMGAAMYLPFLVLFVPLWAGLISSGGLMLAGHLLMLPAMVVAMLLRRDEYMGHHC